MYDKIEECQKTNKTKTWIKRASSLLYVHVTPKIRTNMPICHIYSKSLNR